MIVSLILASLVAVSYSRPDCYGNPYYKDSEGYCECYDWDDTCLYWTYGHSESKETESEYDRQMRELNEIRTRESHVRERTHIRTPNGFGYSEELLRRPTGVSPQRVTLPSGYDPRVVRSGVRP